MEDGKSLAMTEAASQVVKKEKHLKIGWNTFLLAAAISLLILTFTDVKILQLPSAFQLAAIVVLAFFSEYIDSSLGMGYGTTLTPLLLIFGFSPIQIVPAVLLSEFVSGITAGVLHHSFGNVDFRKGTQATKTMSILAVCSIVGTVIAVFLALSLPSLIVKGYIGVMILVIGLIILFGGRLIGGVSFSIRKIITLGTIAAFNKGISGGGYGPLVTGGQVLSGVPEKNAIGITSLAEGLVCLVGLALYVSLNGMPFWNLAIPLTVGALLSVPLAALTVKILPANLLRKYIGYATVFLGALTLIKLFT